MKNRVVDILFAASRLVSQYKEKSVDLAKIEAAIYYLKGVKAARSFFLAVFWMLFGLLMSAMAILLLHIVVLFLIPWQAEGKIFSIVLLGIFDLGVAAAIYLWLFSEKRWMHFTKSDELTEKVA